MTLMVVSASCERETIPSEPKMIATFDAVAENPEKTKVSINEDYVLSWEEGDKILVNDGHFGFFRIFCHSIKSGNHLWL